MTETPYKTLPEKATKHPDPTRFHKLSPETEVFRKNPSKGFRHFNSAEMVAHYS
jgi:hypothetical protein